MGNPGQYDVYSPIKEPAKSFDKDFCLYNEKQIIMEEIYDV
jgi:hypothetical protein